MKDVKELLNEIDAEINAGVESEVQANEESIKANAQVAYDNAVQEEVAKIKDKVSEKYATAKAYLEQLLPVEAPAEEVVSEESAAPVIEQNADSTVL